MTTILIFSDDIQEMEALTAELRKTNKHANIGHRNGQYFRENEMEQCDQVYVLSDYPAVKEAYKDKLVDTKPSKQEPKPVVESPVSKKKK